MKAQRLESSGTPLVLREIATPSPGPGEVLVRIAAAGVCHSDLHLRDGHFPPFRIPLTLGHENAGWVAELGEGVAGIKVGEPVVVYGGWGCGLCKYCLGGAEQLCDKARWSGLGPDGGFAEYMLVPHARHLIPAGDLDLGEAAALTDAGLTPYRAVKKAVSRLVPGSTALIIGFGGLGQYGLQYLKLLTSSRVIVVESSASKRELAKSLGADVVLDGTSEHLQEEVRAAASGSVTAALDFVGIDATLQLAASTLARQGLLVVLGLGGGVLPYSMLDVASEIEITGSDWGSRNDLAEVVALAQGGALTTSVRRFRLSQANEVLDMLGRGEIEGRAILIP